MIRVDEWGDEDTWTGWFANNVLYYPSIDLRMSDMRNNIRNEMRRADREINKIAQDEKRELDGFKACARKGVDYKELEQRAKLVSGHRARKRRQLDHKKAYQRCLQEIEEIQRMKKETTDLKKMGAMLTSINRKMTLLGTQKMLKRFEMEKEKLNTKSEWVGETLEDEDTEYDNKIQDSDMLIRSLLDECELKVSNLPPAPKSIPEISKPESSNQKGKEKASEHISISNEDEALIKRVGALGGDT